MARQERLILDPPRQSTRTSFTQPLLVFAIVRPIGIDVSALIEELETSLHDANFDVETIRLSELLPKQQLLLKLGFRFQTEPEDERYRSFMDAGDILRATTSRPDAMAVLGLSEIRRVRRRRARSKSGRSSSAVSRRGLAIVLRSLMHPDEVRTLRRVYGKQLFVISASAPVEERELSLARKIASSRGGSEEEWKPTAASLLNREHAIGEQTSRIGTILGSPVNKQNLLDVSGTFELGDLFVSVRDTERSRLQVRRLVELIFSNPFRTPTRDEYAMVVAHQTGLRSAALSRQVGACLVDEEGDVLAVGCNEAPKFGGGLYWEGDEPDGRDFQRRIESNDAIIGEILSDLLRRIFSEPSWIEKSQVSSDDMSTVRRLLKRLSPTATAAQLLKHTVLRGSDLTAITEFHRVVHAEMAAISDAAKRGVALAGSTLMCTTFPCHGCAKHIVATGIRRVVYVEAYPKSRVARLHDDSIGLSDQVSHLGRKVAFEPYVGVSSRRYSDLFSWVERKMGREAGSKKGSAVKWSLASADLRETIVDREAIRLGSRNREIDQAEDYWVGIFQERVRDAVKAVEESRTGSLKQSRRRVR